MHGLFKKISLAFIGILVVTASFALDEKLSAKTEARAPKFFEISDKGVVVPCGHINCLAELRLGLADAEIIKDDVKIDIKAGAEKPLEFIINENSRFNLDASTEASFDFSAFEMSRKADAVFTKGRMWINTRNSALSLVIRTKVFEIFAEPGVFDLSYENGQLKAQSIRRSLQISFLENTFVVPEGNSITLPSPTLPSPAALVSDDWITSNQKSDAAFLARYREQRINSIREGGAVKSEGGDSILERFIKRTQLLLTFDSSKTTLKQTQSAFDFFDAAVYTLLIGKENFASKLLDEFNRTQASIAHSDIFQRQLIKRLDGFSFVSPSDQFFIAYSALRSMQKHSQLVQLHSLFTTVLDSAYEGEDEETLDRTVDLLRNFGRKTEQALRTFSDKDSAAALLRERELIRNFTQRYPAFLKEESLKILELFEQKYIVLAPDATGVDALAFFVEEKIAMINAIKKLMESERIVFGDGRRLILALNSSIDSLNPDGSVGEASRSELAPFIAFLRTPEADNLRGSFEEQFAQFTHRLAELQEVTELLVSSKGGTQISSFRREELASIVVNDLGAIGVTDIQVVLPEVEDDSRVTVAQAMFEGVILRGTYDTSRKIMSDIVFDNEELPSIRTENLKKFLLIKLGKLQLPSGESTEALILEQSPQSILEKVAKTTLIEELDKLKITVDEKYLGLEKLKEGIIHVLLATLGSGADAIVFSFDVSQKTSVVRGLKVQTVIGEIAVNDEFSLRELPVKVQQIYQRAVFEKQKEEELKKFAETGIVE